MGSTSETVTRSSWLEICRVHAGEWVALDNVRYEPATSQPMEAEVVDTDEDLAELCARMREQDRSSCAILFCEEDAYILHGAHREPEIPPPRASQH